MSRILVVDDEPHLVRTLAINLRASGFEVESAHDGRSALQAVHDQAPDLLVLDLGLPDLDGIEVIRRLRPGHRMPIVVLSARHDSLDKVEALDAGADDYVTKPFGMDELLARVRAALRRGGLGEQAPPPLRVDGIELDFAEARARVDGRVVHLTPTEWRFLQVLARRPGHLVTQAELLREVWGPEYAREKHYLRGQVANLRRKLEADPRNPRLLLTDPGIGYRLRVDRAGSTPPGP